MLNIFLKREELLFDIVCKYLVKEDRGKKSLIKELDRLKVIFEGIFKYGFLEFVMDLKFLFNMVVIVCVEIEYL